MTGRKPDGTFDKGNPGGPGRPRRAVEADYLRALSEVCPLATWREVCQKAVDLAKEGDAPARAWLAKYLCGEATLRESLTTDEKMAMLVEGA